MLNEFEVIGLTLFAAAIAATSQYLMKKSIHKFNISIKGIFSLLKNKFLLVSIFVYLISLVFYLIALSSGELSFVYPTFASTFIFVFIIAKLKLNETMTLHRSIGLILIVLGIFIVAMTY
ncbi:MAG: hypothetical protein QXD23_01465 [Candidatus Micrarchaeaceae archaeon]